MCLLYIERLFYCYILPSYCSSTSCPLWRGCPALNWSYIGGQLLNSLSLSLSDGAGLRTPTQEELMENVMIPKWYLFALNLLKGDDQTVNMIDSDPALPRIPDKLKEVYRVWLETSEDPTWNTIATTLRKVKNIKMARAIEKDFC